MSTAQLLQYTDRCGCTGRSGHNLNARSDNEAEENRDHR